LCFLFWFSWFRFAFAIVCFGFHVPWNSFYILIFMLMIGSQKFSTFILAIIHISQLQMENASSLSIFTFWDLFNDTFKAQFGCCLSFTLLSQSCQTPWESQFPKQKFILGIQRLFPFNSHRFPSHKGIVFMCFSYLSLFSTCFLFGLPHPSHEPKIKVTKHGVLHSLIVSHYGWKNSLWHSSPSIFK
jgi:hypothetical protein